ncbi:MAG: type II toxin-antitoxin system VapC family toxin, partial [Thermofilum sp.]
MLEAVVDASVVVKWFVEEEGSDRALEVRDRYVSGELKLIAPELLPFEVLNALYYKRLFTVEELKSAAEALDAFFFELYPLRGDYAKLALEVAHEN